MKILVTGGAGFIGHHLVEHILKNTDWDIVVLDRLTYAASGFDRLRDINVFDGRRVTILTHDYSTFMPEGIVQEIGQVDYVVNMGAETSVDKSLVDGIPFAVSNVVGTTVLLEWAKTQSKLKRFLQFSTDEVYGAALEGIFFKEWDTMRPSNPYAGSKAGADMMALSYAHSFNLPISISRTMNVLGQRQNSEKFVPKTIRAIVNGEKVVLHGKNKDDLSSRCWIHARNVADAVMFLLDKGETEDMYHIVGEELSVYDIANIINREIKGEELKSSDIEFVDFHTARPGHDKRYAMSGEKLTKMGWTAKIDLEQSLVDCVRWTLNNKRWL